MSTSNTRRVSVDELRALTTAAILRAGAGEPAAAALCDALVTAEMDGLPNHGLARLGGFCDHIKINKVDGRAVPQVSTPQPAHVSVDAGNGLAHPAIEAGIAPAVAVALRQGIALLTIRRAYSAHVLGYHTERMARQGVMALGFANAPASIAPLGGKTKMLGTNPLSFAVPRDGDDPILVDQAASVIAKSEITDRAAAGEDVPLGWVLDSEGNPTTSAVEGLKGTMVPSGGYKGFNLAMLVEVMTACLTGGVTGVDCLPFADMTSAPMNLSQSFILIDMSASSSGAGGPLVDRIVEALATRGGRLPGQRRFRNRRKALAEGVLLSEALIARLRELAA